MGAGQAVTSGDAATPAKRWRPSLWAALAVACLAGAIQVPFGSTQLSTHECATRDDGVVICRDVDFDASYYIHELAYDYQAVYELSDGNEVHDGASITAHYWQGAPHHHVSHFALALGGLATVAGALSLLIAPWAVAGSPRRLYVTGIATLLSGIGVFFLGAVWHVTTWGGGLQADLGALLQLAVGVSGWLAFRHAPPLEAPPLGLPTLPSIVK